MIITDFHLLAFEIVIRGIIDMTLHYLRHYMDLNSFMALFASDDMVILCNIQLEVIQTMEKCAETRLVVNKITN